MLAPLYVIQTADYFKRDKDAVNRLHTYPRGRHRYPGAVHESSELPLAVHWTQNLLYAAKIQAVIKRRQDGTCHSNFRLNQPIIQMLPDLQIFLTFYHITFFQVSVVAYCAVF